MILKTVEYASILEPANIVSPGTYQGVKHWLEERIWGHRLWHRQGPWLIFLEMLNIAAGQEHADRPFGSSRHENKETICSRRRFLLRHLLYRNGELSVIANKQHPDAELWNIWAKYFEQQLDDEVKVDIAFLRSRFPRFRDFASTVKLLRETTVYPSSSIVETSGERRWTSSFIFPFGLAAIYDDMDENFKRDASRFGRTGDILYQMLVRSKHVEELKPVLQSFLNSDRQLTKLTEKIQDPAGGDWNGGERDSSYLPYKSHGAYDRLAEDWLRIFRLKMAAYDAYQHYVTLATFHILLYHAETAAAWIGLPRIHFVCEVLAPRMEAARRLSIESFQQNEGATLRALTAAWQRIVSIEAVKKLEGNDQGLPEEDRVAELRELLDAELFLPEAQHTNCSTIEELKAQVWESIEAKAEDNLAQLHRTYGRACGLVSRRGARLYRYAPTDSFLKTLVITTVERRMELREFLHTVFMRYHLVFGPNEANTALASADFEGTVFEKNARRLEERLKSMGMLNRLSDGVAFVENPNCIM